VLSVLHEQAEALLVFLEAGLLLLHGLDISGKLRAQFLKVRGFLGIGCGGWIHGE
jgi:hypothetical protein